MVNTQHELYGKAVKTLLHDESTRRSLEKDPAGTLRKLGLDVTPEVSRMIDEAQRNPTPAGGYSSAFVSSVVQVATSPVVQVAVSVATSAEIRDKK
jgi:hypothetical protein